jgi:hypothetical protein
MLIDRKPLEELRCKFLMCFAHETEGLKKTKRTVTELLKLQLYRSMVGHTFQPCCPVIPVTSIFGQLMSVNLILS